jgi:hypothetical protein
MVESVLDAVLEEMGAYDGLPEELRSVDFYNLGIEWWMETLVGDALQG